MLRVIMHADINHCYAQIEEMLQPMHRLYPMVVGGHEEKRHGIVLAKNDLCRPAGVKTAQSLMEARQACNDLRIVLPHYQRYLEVSEKVKDIYRQYSDRVESFGVDEAWVDLTHSLRLFGDPIALAKTIQKRVYDEIGLTVSIGLSFNKVFAKLGSDMGKRSGFAYISEDNYKNVVWPLPVGDLLYVGVKTNIKLNAMGIHTIGQLANTPLEALTNCFGKWGYVLHRFANGKDDQAVAHVNDPKEVPKSVGNGMTTIIDMENMEQTRLVLRLLSESVASRMRDENVIGNVVSLMFRDKSLAWYQVQRKLNYYTDNSEDILDEACDLLQQRYDFSQPLRQITVSMQVKSRKYHIQQMSLESITQEMNRDKKRQVDVLMDDLRNKYGFSSIKKCSNLLDKPFSEENVKGDHVVYPKGYF